MDKLFLLVFQRFGAQKYSIFPKDNEILIGKTHGQLTSCPCETLYFSIKNQYFRGVKKIASITSIFLLAISVNLLAQNPGLGQRRYEEAVKVLQTGDREKSIPYFIRTIEADSTHKNALYNLSVLLLESGDATKAEEYASVLVRRYPDFPKVFALRGKIRLAKNDLVGAFVDFKRQNEIAPASEAYAGLGAIALINKDYPGAETFFSLAIDFFPESATAHNDRGISRIMMDKDSAALADFRHAGLLSPFEGFITQNFALAYQKSNQWMPTKNLLKEASEKEGTELSSLNLMGIMEVINGRPNDALPFFMKAIESEPDDMLTLINTGATYIILGDLPKAKKYTELALSISDNMPEALFNRGVIYYYENKNEEACSCWQKSANGGSKRAKRFYMIYCEEN